VLIVGIGGRQQEQEVGQEPEPVSKRSARDVKYSRRRKTVDIKAVVVLSTTETSITTMH
jgi:hypothetical protein